MLLTPYRHTADPHNKDSAGPKCQQCCYGETLMYREDLRHGGLESEVNRTVKPILDSFWSPKEEQKAYITLEPTT